MSKKFYSYLSAAIVAGILTAAPTTKVHAQNPEIEWAQTIGKPGGWTNAVYVRGVTTDRNGNVYSIGYFRDTVDFDAGSGTTVLDVPAADQAMFIMKNNKQGDLVWAKAIKGTSLVYPNGIAIGRADTMMVVGGFYGTVDFNPGTGVDNKTTSGSQDYFALRIDTNGNYISCATGGGLASDFGASITTDATGNFYGTFVIGGSSATDMIVAKYNPDATGAWSAQIAGPGRCFPGPNIAVDASGNVFTTGYFTGGKDFDPSAGTFEIACTGGTSTTGNPDLFLLKLSSTGSFSWVKRVSSSASEYGSGLVVDDAGSVYLSGHFNGASTNFNMSGATSTTSNTLSTSASYDGFIAKYTNDGDFVWVKQVSSPNNVNLHSMEIDGANNLYLSGDFTNNYSLPWTGTATYSAPTTDKNNTLLIKMDTAGSLLWRGNIGITSATGSAYHGLPSLSNDGSWYVPVTYSGSFDFDPNSSTNIITSIGLDDYGLVKLKQCNINDAVTISGTTLTATMTGANYQWIDCATNTPISGATSQSFTPGTSGNFKVAIAAGSCTDTSACEAITVSVAELSNTAQLQVAPNPAKDGQFNVRLSSSISGRAQAYITDAVGRKVWENEIELNKNNHINLGQMDAGMYLLHVVEKGQQTSVKIVLQ